MSVRRLIVLCVLMLLALSASAQSYERCTEAYRENNVVPGLSTCHKDATYMVTRRLWYSKCKQSGEYITRWCGLPQYVEPEDEENRGTNDETDGLPEYDETGNDDSNCAENGGIPTTNETIDFVLGTGTSGANNPLIQNYGTFASVLDGADLVLTGQQAQRGDSGPLFESMFNILFPVLPQDSAIGAAFQDFSQFADETRGFGDC